MFRKGGGATSPALIQPGRVKEISSRFDRVKADVVDRVLASRPHFITFAIQMKNIYVFIHTCVHFLSLLLHLMLGRRGGGGFLCKRCSSNMRNEA